MMLANKMMRFIAFTSILRYVFATFSGLVGCGEGRTASVAGRMRFAVLTTSYGSEDWREREPWRGVVEV